MIGVAKSRVPHSKQVFALTVLMVEFENAPSAFAGREKAGEAAAIGHPYWRWQRLHRRILRVTAGLHDFLLKQGSD